ncbi:MAG: ABC transporter permease [Chloroflexota bacterium]
MRETNAVVTIAYRDVLKFVRDPVRIIATFVFPVVIIVALGGSLQSNLGTTLGYDFLSFTFTGIFAQTLFQSASFGILSLIEDRENDFSQEIFVSPISRYSIVFGKILGETMVALAQGAGITAFAALVGVALTPGRVLGLLAAGFVCCLLGGSFGVIVLSNINNQRTANQIFPFIFLPQFFLAGVFNPIKKLPLYLDVLSHASPMRYAVDLCRAVFYAGRPEYGKVVLTGPLVDLGIIAAMFLGFMVIGTALFVRKEQNR